MLFTQDDYKRIESWLQSRALKDSELLDAEPLNGNEEIAIIQNLKNRKVSLSSLMHQFANEILPVASEDTLGGIKVKFISNMDMSGTGSPFYVDTDGYLRMRYITSWSINSDIDKDNTFTGGFAMANGTLYNVFNYSVSELTDPRKDARNVALEGLVYNVKTGLANDIKNINARMYETVDLARYEEGYSESTLYTDLYTACEVGSGKVFVTTSEGCFPAWVYKHYGDTSYAIEWLGKAHNSRPVHNQWVAIKDSSVYKSSKPLQSALTAGKGINISTDHTISCTIDTNPFVPATSLPTPTKDLMGKIYLIANSNTDEYNLIDEYHVVQDEDGTYRWEIFGLTNSDVDLSQVVSKEEKGVADGVATLDENGKHVVSQLPLETTRIVSSVNDLYGLDVPEGTIVSVQNTNVTELSWDDIFNGSLSIGSPIIYIVARESLTKISLDDIMIGDEERYSWSFSIIGTSYMSDIITIELTTTIPYELKAYTSSGSWSNSYFVHYVDMLGGPTSYIPETGIDLVGIPIGSTFPVTDIDIKFKEFIKKYLAIYKGPPSSSSTSSSFYQYYGDGVWGIVQQSLPIATATKVGGVRVPLLPSPIASRYTIVEACVQSAPYGLGINVGSKDVEFFTTGEDGNYSKIAIENIARTPYPSDIMGAHLWLRASNHRYARDYKAPIIAVEKLVYNTESRLMPKKWVGDTINISCEAYDEEGYDDGTVINSLKLHGKLLTSDAAYNYDILDRPDGWDNDMESLESENSYYYNSYGIGEFDDVEDVETTEV